MASAEANGRWLRFATRCIVDEKYQRASRPPSLIPSSSMSESDKSPGAGVKSYDLLTDSKWWLYQYKDNASSFWNPQWETFTTCTENGEDLSIQELEAVIGETLQKPMLPEVWTEDDHLTDFDPYKYTVCDEPEKLISKLESQWIGIKKNEPWWHTSDLNDLAFFVHHKSLEHFENCDLPQPQTNKPEWFACDKDLGSLNQEPEKEKSSFMNSTPRSPISMCRGETQYMSGVIGCSPYGLDRPCSTANSDAAKSQERPNGELSRAQLLEALCHSQRRAREAEKAALQACNEKEHLITLFVRQASQLFAYKQWLYILQLETLCFQPRGNNYRPMYTRFPDFLQWVPNKGKAPKSVYKAAKGKLGTSRYRLYESVGEFLLGLALVGTGVLLGWTLGWLSPDL